MKYYKSYMDRQTVGDTLHQKLLAAAEVPAAKPRRHWQAGLALAACCVLIAALALWRPAEVPSEYTSDGIWIDPNGWPSGPEGDNTPESGDPARRDMEEFPNWPDYTVEHDYQFLAESGQDEGTWCLPCIQGIDHLPLDAVIQEDYALRLKVPDGAFDMPLTKDEICLILWGGDQTAYNNAQAEGGNVPWLLFWDNYSLSGRACYDGAGNLYTAYIWGVWAGEDTVAGPGRNFTITLVPGVIPPSCIASQGAVTDSRGIQVEGWSYHLDDQYIYECSFLAHGVGTRFTFETEEEDNWTELLFINWCTYYDGGLSLDHLLQNKNIPAWEKYEVSSLAEAREVERFAACLPKTAPAGYADDFYGLVDYQEGVRDQLYLRWSKGYDDVSIRLERPVKEDEQWPYADYPTAFRTEDWSFEAQEAHKYPHDTGGWLYDFELIYPDGTVAAYRIAGMTDQEVWNLTTSALS